MHTNPCSACAQVTPEQMAVFIKKGGFQGGVITNHFKGGNTGIDRKLPWKDFVKAYEKDYIALKEAGEKLDLDFGINFINPIVNAYVLTLINVLINMFIAGYIDKFNLENTRYKTYISGEVYNIKIHSIIEAKFANIIYIILKIKFKLRKVEKKNVRNKTSNRKFDDDSYDFTRKYGRC